MKLNEKGFAISTVLYGLLLVGVLIMALLMNTASFNLMTTKDFVDKTEEELNAVADSYYGEGDTCNFPLDKKNRNVCTAKKTGYYRVNLCSGNCTTGLIFLVVGQKLYYNNNEIRLDNDDADSALMSLSRNFISGSVGSVSIKKPDDDKFDNTGKNITYHYSDKYFINGMITNSISSASMNYSANSDEQEQKRKPEFNGDIRFIEACGGSTNFTEIQVISKGKNIAFSKPVAPVLGSIFDPNLDFITDNDLETTGSSGNTECVTVDIGRDMNNNNEFYRVDQIGVFGSNQTRITLYTEDKVPTGTTPLTGISMVGRTGLYFNAYNE